MSSAIMFVRQYVAAVLLGTVSILAHSSLQCETAARLSETAVMHNPSAQTQYNAAELFSRLIEHNRWQKARLDRFSVVRTYKVEDDKGKTLAEEVVVMEYKAPGTKDFQNHLCKWLDIHTRPCVPATYETGSRESDCPPRSRQLYHTS